MWETQRIQFLARNGNFLCYRILEPAANVRETDRCTWIIRLDAARRGPVFLVLIQPSAAEVYKSRRRMPESMSDILSGPPACSYTVGVTMHDSPNWPKHAFLCKLGCVSVIFIYQNVTKCRTYCFKNRWLFWYLQFAYGSFLNYEHF